MSYSCPPDVPLLDLFWWYGKQFIVVLSIIIVIGGCYFILMWQPWRKFFK